MAKYELRFPDGAAITAIGTLEITWLVNDSQDIAPGSACAAMLEATLFDPVVIEADTELACYEDGVLLGRFICQQPRRAGQNTLALTAYDRMIRFDREVAGWLSRHSFPTTAQALLEDLCAHCGVTLAAETALPDMTVQAFDQPGLTGRQLLQYLGQAAGRFLRIDAEGCLEAAWYAEAATDLSGFRMGSLVHADYTAAPIERVLIRASGSDTGTVWPDGSDEEANTCILQGNPLLPPGSGLQTVARRLYEQLSAYRCTPFSCGLLPGSHIRPGDTISFTDAAGNRHTTPVMKLTLKNGLRSIQATASASLQSTEAFNRLQLESLPGRVLTVERTAQALKAENTDIRGNAAALTLRLEGITGRVAAVEEETGQLAPASAVSVLEQRADSLSVSLTQLRRQTDAKADQAQLAELTEHFLFSADGLTISNTATGMGISVSERQVAFTGGESPTTVITPNAMTTTQLCVGTRLDLGNFSLIPRTNQNLSLRYTAE